MNPQDKREVEELIAAKLDIMSAFRDLPEAAREEIANDIGPYVYSRLQSQEKPKNFYTPRWTKGMLDINLDNNAAQQGHAGPTMPRWIDIVGGTAYLDSSDPQILHIATGGGADCMFTRLVSACWATEVAAGRGVEGQQMTSLTGCTFNVYSTPFGASGAIAAMNAAAATAAGLGNPADEILFICSGTYSTSVSQAITPNLYSSFRIVGAGQQAVTFTSGSNSIVLLAIGGVQQGAVFTLEEVCIDLTAGSRSLCTAIDFGGSAQASVHNNTFMVGALNVGIKPGASSAECRVYDNIFNSGGAGIGTDTTGNHLTSWGNSFILMERGVVMSNNSQHTITDNLFYQCTTGIEFSGNSASTDCVIADNRFNGCVKGINALTGSNFQYNTVIAANIFTVPSAGVGIDFSEMNASGLIMGWAIGPNTFRALHASALGIRGDAQFTVNQILHNGFHGFTSGNEISALAATTFSAHNFSVSAAGANQAIADNGSPVGHTGLSGGAAAAPSPHNLVSSHHDGEQDYTNALYLGELRLGVNGTTGDLTWYSDAGTTAVAAVDGATGNAEFGNRQISLTRESAAAIVIGHEGITGTKQIRFEYPDVTTEDALTRLFRTTNTTGAIELAVYQGDATTTQIFSVARLASGVLRAYFTGYFRVGSSTTPTNTTAGDITGTRLIVPDAAIVHSAITQLGGPVVIPTQGALRLSDTDNSHYTGLKAHATTTATVEYTLPPADGTSGFQLTTDGAGVLSWASAGGAGGGHTIRENGTDQTSRTGLNFIDADAGAGLITDDAGGNETEVNLSLYRLEAQDHSHLSTGLQGGLLPATKTITLTAASGIPKVTAGAPPAAIYDSGTNDITSAGVPFDTTTAEYLTWSFPAPRDWNLGTITAQFYWRSTAANTSVVVWGIRGVAGGDGDDSNTAMGTGVTVSDAGETSTTKTYVTAATGAVTIAGTPVKGDKLFIEVYRDTADAADTLVSDAVLTDVVIFYTSTGLDFA